eukprot:gene10423-biopygen13843
MTAAPGTGVTGQWRGRDAGVAQAWRGQQSNAFGIRTTAPRIGPHDPRVRHTRRVRCARSAGGARVGAPPRRWGVALRLRDGVVMRSSCGLIADIFDPTSTLVAPHPVKRAPHKLPPIMRVWGRRGWHTGGSGRTAMPRGTSAPHPPRRRVEVRLR